MTVNGACIAKASCDGYTVLINGVQKCVSECPVWASLLGKQCVENCPANQVRYTDSVVCTEDSKFDGSIPQKFSNQSLQFSYHCFDSYVNQSGECQHKCDKMYSSDAENRTCKSCPKMWDRETVTCVNQCSSEQGYNDSVCETIGSDTCPLFYINKNGKHICVDSCPKDYP